MRRQSLIWLAVLAFGLSLGGLTKAARAADAKPTGTWKWEVTRQNGDKIEVTLKLKQEGDKLTGTITGRDNSEIEIKEGKVKGEDVSWVVEREFGGNKIVQKYTAKVTGDTIKGKTEFERNGETVMREFEGKRAS